MIEISDLTIRYGSRTILQNYTLNLKRGKILAILGANGIGKTTFMSALIGLIKPKFGSIRIQGQVGFVPQLFEVPFTYSALDIGLMRRARHLGLFSAPSARDYDIVRHYFDMLGIQHFQAQTFNSLSGGQRQLVMITQALASECEVLILDEPCAALDYKNQDRVLDILMHLCKSQNMTIVFSTHMPQHAVEIASDVLLMMSTNHYVCGSTAYALTSENLTALYSLPISRADFDGLDKHTYAPIFCHSRMNCNG